MDPNKTIEYNIFIESGCLSLQKCYFYEMFMQSHWHSVLAMGPAILNCTFEIQTLSKAVVRASLPLPSSLYLMQQYENVFI